MIRFRIIFPVMAVATILILLAPPALVFISATLSYHGICYGFTDGSWPCPWQEYISDAILYSTLLDIPLSLYILPAWSVALGLWLYKRHTTDSSALPLALVITIPLGGCVGGVCLISILPVFISFFYRLHP
jgi:hypothetical protein